jgi:hypothetical protein
MQQGEPFWKVEHPMFSTSRRNRESGISEEPEDAIGGGPQTFEFQGLYLQTLS